MTVHYQKSGIRFLYPENWQITDEQLDASPLSVSVQSPDSAFWQLMIYESPMEPRSLLDQVLTSMQAEYEGVESAVIHDQFADVESLGYDMCFYCLDFLVNARALAAQARGKTILVLWQAEDREFDRLEPVFRAMTISLLGRRSESAPQPNGDDEHDK